MNVLFFSIIIPVYNDPTGIKETLRAISNLNFPSRNFEVIIIDNASNDDTANAVKIFTNAQNNFYLLNEKIRSSYAARNTGIMHAKGKVLLFIDANMTVEKNWLKQVKQFVGVTNADYFGMRVAIKTNRNGGICYTDEQLTGFPVHSYLSHLHFVPTCCLGVSKKLISQVGNFDSRLVSGGDQEFGHRVSLLNIKQLYAPGIVISHPPRTTVKGVLKKNLRIGRGFYQLGMFYPERYQEKVRNVLNPVYLLPPLLKKYTDIINGDSTRQRIWRQLGTYTKFKLFLLWWLRKLAVHSGYLNEFLRSRIQTME